MHPFSAIVGGGLAVLSLALAARELRPVDRVKVGNAWAIRHQALVTAELVPEFDRRMAALRRARALDLALTALAWGGIALYGFRSPAGGVIFWTGMTLGTVVRVALVGREATRPYTFPADSPRAARSRAVSLGDLLGARALVGLGLVALSGVIAAPALASADAREGNVVAILAGLGPFLAALAAVAVAARTIAQPEPAVDAASLYLQDAWRQDYVEELVHVADTVASVILLGVVIPRSGHAALWVGLLPLLAYVVGLVLIGMNGLRFRRSLWPMLAPGEVLRPGEAVAAKR